MKRQRKDLCFFLFAAVEFFFKFWLSIDVIWIHHHATFSYDIKQKCNLIIPGGAGFEISETTCIDGRFVYKQVDGILAQ